MHNLHNCIPVSKGADKFNDMATLNDKNRISTSSQVIFILLLALMILPWLGETVFYSKGEPREAILAVSILDGGDWLLPRYYGDELPFKPPFLGWAIAAFSWLFNGGTVTEYLSRLPSAIAMILMCWGIMRWTAKARGEKFGFICGLVAATMFEVFRAGTNCRLDMVLTAAMCCAMFIMFNLHEYPKSRRRGWKYFSVIILLTIATMTKGPVGALLPCFIMGVFALLRGDRFFVALGKYLGLAVVALILPAVWCYFAWQQGGQRFLDLMMEENFGRLFGTMSYASHVNPWYYNFISIVAGMAPWTLFMLLALIDIKRYKPTAFKPLGLLSMLSVVIVLVFFTIPESKRSVYLLPAYPFLAYWVTCTLKRLSDTRLLKSYAWFLAILSILVVGGVITMQFVTLDNIHLDFAPMRWYNYLLLFVPIIAAIGWMFFRREPALCSAIITLTLFMAYLSVIQPMAVNNRSDLQAVPAVTKAAPQGYVYSIDETYPPVRYYTINYYIGDRMRRAASFHYLDSMPEGTVVLFSGAMDSTVVVPDYLDVTRLLEKSNDNRKPLMMGIKKSVAPDSLYTDSDVIILP